MAGFENALITAIRSYLEKEEIISTIKKACNDAQKYYTNCGGNN
jgi:hypothetical protein